MTQLYEIKTVEGERTAKVWLTYEEFRKVMREGVLNDTKAMKQHKLLWIQMVGFSDKRVTFAENQPEGSPNGAAVS